MFGVRCFCLSLFQEYFVQQTSLCCCKLIFRVILRYLSHCKNTCLILRGNGGNDLRDNFLGNIMTVKFWFSLTSAG